MLDGTPAVNWLGTKLEEIPPILLILSSEVIPVRVFWLHRTKLRVKRKHTIMTGITATLLLWANVLDISPGKCQKRCKVCDKHELRHIKECARGKMKICDVAHVIQSRVYT
jgi:hypothetical protein